MYIMLRVDSYEAGSNPVAAVSSGGAYRRLLCWTDRLFAVRMTGDWIRYWMVEIVVWLLVGGVNEILVVRCWVLIQESVTRLSTRIADTAFW